MASVIWEEGQEFVKAAFKSCAQQLYYCWSCSRYHLKRFSWPHQQWCIANTREGGQQKKKWPTNIPAFSYVIAQKKGRDLPSSQILKYFPISVVYRAKWSFAQSWLLIARCEGGNNNPAIVTTFSTCFNGSLIRSLCYGYGGCQGEVSKQNRRESMACTWMRQAALFSLLLIDWQLRKQSQLSASLIYRPRYVRTCHSCWPIILTQKLMVAFNLFFFSPSGKFDRFSWRERWGMCMTRARRRW